MQYVANLGNRKPECFSFETIRLPTNPLSVFDASFQIFLTDAVHQVEAIDSQLYIVKHGYLIIMLSIIVLLRLVQHLCLLTKTNNAASKKGPVNVLEIISFGP